MIKNIRHTGIVVENLQESLHFYQDLLGFKITKQADEKGEFISTISALKNVEVTTVKMALPDGQLIELLWYKSHPRIKKNREVCDIGIGHIAFSVENLTAVYNKLVSIGIPFNAPPQISPDGFAKVIFCKAPEGTLIELVQEL